MIEALASLEELRDRLLRELQDDMRGAERAGDDILQWRIRQFLRQLGG